LPSGGNGPFKAPKTPTLRLTHYGLNPYISVVET
jgi:hypothetical protein